MLGVSKISQPPEFKFSIIKIGFLINVIEAPASRIVCALILIIQIKFFPQNSIKNLSKLEVEQNLEGTDGSGCKTSENFKFKFFKKKKGGGGGGER